MQNIEFIQKLTIPKELKERFPVTEKTKKIKEERDAEIRRIFTGESDKFILIIGPCSADNEAAVLDFISRL